MAGNLSRATWPLVGQQTPFGPVPKRVAPIFRDRDELPSAPDLGEEIRHALKASLCLVVVASPRSARSEWVDREVTAFKAMGRADRVFAIVVDGEPNASDHPGFETQECFCPALRFEVNSFGELTSVRCEPLAADARSGSDGSRDAVLKLLAGILGLGFDQLKQRERLRRRRRILGSIAAATVLAMGLIFGYVSLADLNIGVPGASIIRTEIDHWGISIFRPTISANVVLSELTKSRSLMRQRLLDVIGQPEWLQRKSLSSVWEFGQLATALARNPRAEQDDIQLAARQLTAALDIKPPVQVNGRWLGWTEPDDTIRAETSLWVLMGTAAVLSVHGSIPESTRADLIRLLTIAQQAADQCRPSNDGGWNDVPDRDDLGDHSVYTTALALQALIDLKEANLCWNGECGRLDTMIASAASWLVGAFDSDLGHLGWRVNPRDDESPNPNISSLVLGALGRTTFVSGITLPGSIRDFAYDQILQLDDRPYQPSSAGIEKFAIFTDWTGTERQARIASSLLWLPWSYEAALVWQKLAARDKAPSEIQHGMARSLGHLAVTLAGPMRQEVDDTRTRPYVTAETMAELDRTP
jgi:hypothetical protein